MTTTEQLEGELWAIIKKNNPHLVNERVTNYTFHQVTCIVKELLENREAKTRKLTDDQAEQKRLVRLSLHFGAEITTEDAKHVMRQVASAPVDGEVPLTELGLMELRGRISGLDLIVQYIVVSADVWAKLIAQEWAVQVLDPVSRFEMIKCGVFGIIYGMNLMSDSFLQEEDRILVGEENKNTIAVVSATKRLGVKISRAKVLHD